MTDDWESGFRIGETFHAWGTPFEAVASGRIDRGYATTELPCRSAYSFVMPRRRRPGPTRDAYRSSGIAWAVAALERLPGLKIERHAGNDA